MQVSPQEVAKAETNSNYRLDHDRGSSKQALRSPQLNDTSITLQQGDTTLQPCFQSTKHQPQIQVLSEEQFQTDWNLVNGDDALSDGSDIIRNQLHIEYGMELAAHCQHNIFTLEKILEQKYATSLSISGQDLDVSEFVLPSLDYSGLPSRDVLPSMQDSFESAIDPEINDIFSRYVSGTDFHPDTVQVPPGVCIKPWSFQESSIFRATVASPSDVRSLYSSSRDQASVSSEKQHTSGEATPGNYFPNSSKPLSAHHVPVPPPIMPRSSSSHRERQYPYYGLRRDVAIGQSEQRGCSSLKQLSRSQSFHGWPSTSKSSTHEPPGKVPWHRQSFTQSQRKEHKAEKAPQETREPQSPHSSYSMHTSVTAQAAQDYLSLSINELFRSDPEFLKELEMSQASWDSDVETKGCFTYPATLEVGEDELDPQDAAFLAYNMALWENPTTDRELDSITSSLMPSISSDLCLAGGLRGPSREKSTSRGLRRRWTTYHAELSESLHQSKGVRRKTKQFFHHLQGMIHRNRHERGKDTAHPYSLKAAQIQRALGREAKLQLSKANRQVIQNVTVERYLWFRDEMGPSKNRITRADVHALVKRYLCRHDEEMAAIQSQRRKGQPPPKKLEALSMVKAKDEAEYRSGMKLPDLTHEATRSYLSGWNGDINAFNNFRFMTVRSDEKPSRAPTAMSD
ncbi:translation machinery-associated protein 16 [Dispira simplex]|nr:translation machinery-associated protein 16 [Dispira simplex]